MAVTFLQLAPNLHAKEPRTEFVISSGGSYITSHLQILFIETTGKIWEEVFEPPQQGRVICFDLETTGFSREDGIIEIGAVELIDGYRTGVLFQSYAKPR